MTNITIPKDAQFAGGLAFQLELSSTGDTDSAIAAAFKAMIKAWPGMTTDGRWSSPFANAVWTAEVILPLPEKGEG